MTNMEIKTRRSAMGIHAQNPYTREWVLVPAGQPIPEFVQASVAPRPARRAYRPSWHISPDGTPCCCTAQDRRYGTGCH
jgi:hypothetical protein